MVKSAQAPWAGAGEHGWMRGNKGVKAEGEGGEFRMDAELLRRI